MNSGGKETVLVVYPVSGSPTWRKQENGLRRFVFARGWNLKTVNLRGRDLISHLSQLMQRVKPAGVISELSVTVPPDILGSCPIVYYDCPMSIVPPDVPHFRHDAQMTAHLAASELFSVGHANFAYLSAPGSSYWSEEREICFEKEVKKRGGFWNGALHCGAHPDKRVYSRLIRQWALTLPKPCSVFAANDENAMLLLQVCGRNGIRVPQDIAVVGVDDNESICSSTNPSLSSVAPDWEAGAFMAATALDCLIKGGTVDNLRQTFRPLGLIGRGSTACVSETVNVRVVKAVEMIRSQACEGLRARDVVKQMGCSRRLAELRFREVTGRSILEEIRRIRHENARLLLSRTDVPIALAANRSGWASVPSFCREFKGIAGLTPSEWRLKSIAPG